MSAFGDPTTQVAFSIHENRGVFALLLGSGLSRAAEIPTGWEITLDLVRRVGEVEGAPEQADWRAWYVEKEGKEPDYSDLLAKLAKTPAERRAILHSYIEPNDEDREEGRKLPTNAHKAIARLVRSGHVRVIVTTNFDRLMENALREEGVEPTVVSSVDTLKGAEPLSHSACYVFKVHGDYKDTRILNTAQELDGYPDEFNSLLDRILDEYGLVICGWSGEWDQALRSAITRAPNRRYPLFWASRGDLKEGAQALSDLRGGIVVPIKDADTFFPDLSERVQTLERSRRQSPVSIDILLNRTKRYLSKPEYRIQLADLITDETRRIIERLEHPDMGTRGEFNAEEWKRRLDVYESAVEGLAKSAGLAGRWGDTHAAEAITDAIHSLWAHAEDNGGGLVVFCNLRTYPAMLVFEAYSLGLMKAKRWNELMRAFQYVLTTRGDIERVAVELLSPIWWRSDLLDAWKKLSGYERRHTPLEDYLIEEVFKDWAGAFYGSVHEFETEFDFLCMLTSIIQLEGLGKDMLEAILDGRHGQRKYQYANLSRSIWNRSTRERNLSKFESDAFQKELCQSGYFDGDQEYLRLAVQNFRRCLEENSRW